MSDVSSAALSSTPAPPAEPAPEDARGWRRHAPKLVASLILVIGFVWMLRRGGIPLLPEKGSFDGIAWWTIGVYALTFCSSMWFRTYRWVYLLRPLDAVSARRVFAIGLVGYAAILFAPLRMGEVVRPYMIAQRTKITFTQAMGTIAAERIIDGLAVSIVLFFGLLASNALSPMPDHLGSLPVPVNRIHAATYGMLALFVSAFVAMGLFHWRRAFAERATATVVGVVSTRLAAWLTKRVEQVADGLGFLPDTKHSVPFFRDTVFYWCSNVLGTWITLYGCGFAASPSEACVVMGVVGLGILIPSGPGFFGAYQLALYTALAMFFPESQVLHAGSAYVFITYTFQVVGTILSMFLGFALDRP